MIYTHILFDLDGTLTDPKIGITKSVQYALAKYGIEEKAENLTAFIGPPLNINLQKYYGFSEEESMEVVSYFREYYSAKGMYESTVYKGIPGLLEKLKAGNNK